MERLKAVTVLAATLSPLLSLGQTIDEKSFTFEAAVQQNANGTTTIHAISPRPLYQALQAVTGSLPATVDYEDPQYTDREMHGDPGVNRRLNGGSLTATVDLGHASTEASSEEIVRELVSQFDKEFSIHFKLERHEGSSRLDVIPDVPGYIPLLNTKLVLDAKERSVSETIDLILREVAHKTGTCVARGGFIDNELSARVMPFKAQEPTPARDLLAQALSAVKAPRAWLLAYEPSNGCFYMALTSAGN